MIPWVDLHNVGYGQCIVLGAGDSLLMADCGSLNACLPNGQNFSEYVTQSLTARCSSVPHRAFLLSHFHRDHVNGLWELLRQEPAFFEELYLPCPPCDDRGLPLLLEYAAFTAVFLRESGGLTDALSGFYRVLQAAPQADVYSLGQGDTLENGGILYECVWPPRENFPYDNAFTELVEELHRCADMPGRRGGNVLGRFLCLLYDFCDSYLEMCRAQPVTRQDAERTQSLLQALVGMAPVLRRLPAADEIAAMLQDRAARELYSSQMNAASVIFQGEEGGVLMTGDATAQALLAAEPLLYPSYCILQAPHHGQRPPWSDVCRGAEHILISCGGRPGADAAAAPEWAAMPGVKHCTAPVCEACLRGGCRGKRTPCGDFGGAARRCPGNRGGEPPCGICTLGTEAAGCLCGFARRW